MTDSRSGAVGRLFDEVAPFYDQTGVAFMGPIADRLVDLLDPQPGEQVVDLGCGRGAMTTRLARRVGPQGHVAAVDLSANMVAATREQAAREGLTCVDVQTGDAADPDLPAGSASLVTASLVLFFLPDPQAAVRRWLELLTAGGRIGFTTFGAQDDVWRRVDELFDPYLPPRMLDARTSGRRGPFASPATLAAMVHAAGGTVVQSLEEPLRVCFTDVDQWERFSRSTGQRQMWDFVPDGERAALRVAAAGLLDSTRPGPGAPIEVSQVVRYTLVRAAEATPA